ncbi:MAG: esterase-like activity of phytase family protein [Phycisphaerales bacterium]|nr:esterase-like activity of phytase family protein [Phycisphaerales bacterium]
MLTTLLAALPVLVAGSASPWPAEVPQLVAVASIPFDATDKSGLTDDLGTMPHNRLGSMGSAIDWLGPKHGLRVEGEGAARSTWATFILAADRGPADGAYEYACRVQTITLQWPETLGTGAAPVMLAWRNDATSLLTRDGDALVGRATRIDRRDPSRSRRLDPEGLRVLPDGSWLISEEYAPAIRVFSADGRQQRDVTIPPGFSLTRPGPSTEEDQFNVSGRAANRGFEGLAISPDGQTATAILQSPLLQDGGRNGLHARILQINLSTGTSRQLVYPLADSSYGLNEILAIDNDRFVVIERDGTPGAKAGFKAITLIDTRGATDVSEVPMLPKRWLPKTITPVRRTVLIDLLDDRYGLAGETFPEKIEGLSWGPDLPDGRRTLIVTSDNDFLEKPTAIWVFAIAGL